MDPRVSLVERPYDNQELLINTSCFFTCSTYIPAPDCKCGIIGDVLIDAPILAGGRLCFGGLCFWWGSVLLTSGGSRKYSASRVTSKECITL